MSQLDVVIKDIVKKYGDIVETGIEKTDYDRIPFSSPRLNYMTYGGLPVGHIYEFSGPEGSGKTTTAFDVMKNAQRKFKDRKILFVDVEGTFDYTWAKKFGVDTTKIIRVKAAGWPAADVLDMTLETLKTGEIGLAIIDSIAAMVPDQLEDKGVGEKIYGGIAMSLQNFCNKAKKYLVQYEATVICINQVRDNLNSMFGGTTTPGGRGFKHACSGRFEFRKGKFIDNDNKELTSAAENPAGNKVNVVILKSKVFPSMRRVGYYTIKYVTGPDLINDYVEVGLQVDVIKQRGSYFDIMNPETGELLYDDKIQGKTKLLELLQQHPEWLKLIDEVVDGKEVTEVVDENTLAEANEVAQKDKE